MNKDYEKAKELGIISKDRWIRCIAHHPMSERIMEFLAEHDFKDYDDYFCWKLGGDGDNGESLMYEMDAFFEMLDKESAKEVERAEKVCEEMGWEINKKPCKSCRYGPTKKDCKCPAQCKDNIRWTPIKRNEDDNE